MAVIALNWSVVTLCFGALHESRNLCWGPGPSVWVPASLGDQWYHHFLRGPANSSGCFQETGFTGPYFPPNFALHPTSWCGENFWYSLIALKHTPCSVLCWRTPQKCFHQSRLLQKQGKLNYLLPEASISCSARELAWSKGAKARKETLWNQGGNWEGILSWEQDKNISTCDYSLQFGPCLFDITHVPWKIALNTGIRFGMCEQELFCDHLSQVEMVEMDLAYLQDWAMSHRPMESPCHLTADGTPWKQYLSWILSMEREWQGRAKRITSSHNKGLSPGRNLPPFHFYANVVIK